MRDHFSRKLDTCLRGCLLAAAAIAVGVAWLADEYCPPPPRPPRPASLAPHPS